jgi:hypothetical protein
MKPNTVPLLDLSTGHLSLSTRETLEKVNVCDDLGVTWRPYGYLVNANPDHYEGKDVPPDLLHCVRYAHANGAAYLLFDQDAAPQTGLPYYDDTNTPDLTGTGIQVSQLIMDGEVTYVNPNHVDPDALRVEPTWTEPVGDRDVEAVEGALWVGIGPASVRLRVDAEGDLHITALPRGQEMGGPVHEVSLAADMFTAEPDGGLAP